MAKVQKRFVCSNCGAESPTWAGKCHTCGQWNTLEEEIVSLGQKVGGKSVTAGTSLKTTPIKNFKSTSEPRIPINYGDLDRVCGGGIVPGSVILIAGEPGIGKSTMLLQLCEAIAAQNHPVLYVSGEESAHQVGLRAKRLGVGSAQLQLATTTQTNDIVETIYQKKYKVVIVDSIQTMAVRELNTSSGSVSQINSSTHLLVEAAKQSGTCVILVGHVTKEGAIAGPKILEHIVDAVLQLEGDRYGGFKVIRSVKNRFGSTNEVALFEMQDEGLVPVDNPSKALLAERQAIDGSVVLATMEGTRPILVEVQALVNKTSFGYPKRTASGIEINRLNLLVAMLEKRTKLQLSDQDIYINIVGGMRLQEPAADLAVCMAIGSATRGMQLKQNAVVFGEVGLSGEVRHVPFIEKRIDEAKKLGFDLAIGPKMIRGKKPTLLHSVADVRTALNTFLESSN